MALAAYRHLLRATRIAFKGTLARLHIHSMPIDLTILTGDTTLLHAARAQCRHDFSKNAHISPTSPEASEGIKHAEDVAKILRMNVVQGEKDGETGNISATSLGSCR